MRFMVIEHFRGGDASAVYAQLEARGRMIPEGVTYVDSWVAESGAHCFQLMDCASEAELQPWIDAWADLVDFEVVPVVDSVTAAGKFKG